MTFSPIEVFFIKKNAIGNLNIRGKVIQKNFGLFAVKVVNTEDVKNVKIISYQFIDFDFEHNTFNITFDLEESFNNPPKILEFFLKSDPRSIKYGEKYKAKTIPKYLQLSLKVPLIIFPTVERKHRLSTIRNSKLKKSILQSFCGNPPRNSSSDHSETMKSYRSEEKTES